MPELETRRPGAPVPAAPYENRPPSPPPILIPAPLVFGGYEPMVCVPSYANIDPMSLSATDLEIITRNKPQEAHDRVHDWEYEDRRQAQEILDFLYLGPSTAARDCQWLRDNGITMLLAARDSRMAQARLMGVDRVARELGLHAEYVDVENHQELIRAFPEAIRKINNHLLGVYRSQAVQGEGGAVGEGSMLIDKNNIRHGKVLVFCETGNDRSAGVVVAYLMAVFGMEMVRACQFIQFRRFCAGLDEDMKYLLQTYEGILTAEKTVHRHQLHSRRLSQPPATSNNHAAGASTNPSRPAAANPTVLKASKRHIEDTMDEDEDGDATMGELEKSFQLDQDRYLDRPAFVPFVDRSDP
jgi:serine/threonine/tyrosine-interacting protein